MSCLNFNGTPAGSFFTPSSALNALPNGAGTIALLVRIGATSGYLTQLMDSSIANWYHGINVTGTATCQDDDGLVGASATGLGWTSQTSGAGNYVILTVDWPSGGAATERFHCSALMSAAESWTHANTSGNNGGNRAGPGTGRYYIGGDGEAVNHFTGDIALVGVWAGTRFSDANVTDLWNNKATSDWYNHPAGKPTMLVECTSTTLVDIGQNPSTFSTNGSTGLTAPDPQGWTFDGQGAAAPGPAFVPRAMPKFA